MDQNYPLNYMLNEINLNNKEESLKQVQNFGIYLQYVSKELRNDKEVVFAAINSNGYALKYASEELKNDKEVVLVDVNKNGYSLKYASNKLQNDLGLLKLLKNYHMSKSINDYSEEYKIWYTERMAVLDIFNQQLYLEKTIPNNSGKHKTRKF